MDPRTQERVEEWDTRPFSGGFDGLSDLAAADFSGAVSAAGTWLFMLNGRIVGVFEGDIEDFETASGTQYEAPHPSLPLLCTMEERGGETRAKYYTNETPLSEVDTTLQSGSFTGYVELSENVLSGDYYAVYYGGRRMAAAYIGNAERLLTGDEAFERAADEVGIYEVIDVEIEVTDVPGTDAASPSDGGADDHDSSSASESIGSDTSGGTADVSADPTESSIEPIDVSSTDPVDSVDAGGSDPIGDVTVDDDSSMMGDIDLTDDPTGITATDESETDSEPSKGITDAESTTDPTPDRDSVADEAMASEDEPGVERAVGIEEAESDESIESEIDDSSDPTDDVSAENDATPADDEEGRSGPSATDADATAPNADGDTFDETGTEADGELTAGSSPDLAEVEAAAEELDQNDISWVEEDEDAAEIVDQMVGAEPTAESETAAATEEDGDLEEQFEREEAWRETRRIPSIDPDNSETSESADSGASGGHAGPDRSSKKAASTGPTGATSSNSPGTDSRATGQTAESTSTAASRRSADRTRDQPSQSATNRAQTTESATESGGDQERAAALTEKVETLQEQRDALVTKAEELEAERDRLRSENDELSSTVERLQSRIEELESEVERERARERDTTAGAGTNAGTRLSPDQALSETNLFVRYASKSQPTLDTAHDGNADRSEVAANLRLEHHTQFDSADTVVDGTPYEEFLASTMEYRFVDWLTEQLLYEIRDTGNADRLADLYDAIPRIDRAELGATISLEDDDTEDVPDQVTFDIVAFDKMGNPLVLATLNDSREPATKELLEQLEEAASAVKANYPDLAASIAVTSSYFEPGALEVAEQATSGGFLSRGSKLSYVNLTRKEGYHLCLVESRSEGFHMNVPEL